MLPDLAEIGKKRKLLRLTQLQLGERTGVSRSTIAKVETGRLVLSYNVAKKIFEELEMLEKYGRILVNIKLGDVASKNVVYIDSNETIYDVWLKMNKRGFSQFPVRKDEVIEGSISERGINRALMSGSLEVRKKPVISIIEEPFPLFSSTTRLLDVIPLLQRYQALLVTYKGRIDGIVCNADVGKVLKGAD